METRMLKIVILLTVLSVLSQAAHAANWYVDKSVSSSGDGRSWTTAWKELSNIQWNSVQPGDTIYLGAGTYTSQLAVGKSGTSDANRITIRAAQDTKVGVATIDGGGSRAPVDVQSKSWITIDGQYGTSRNIKLYNGPSGGYSAIIEAYAASGLKLNYVELQKGGTGLRNNWVGSGGAEVAYCYFHDINGQTSLDFTSTDPVSKYDHIKIHHNLIESSWSVSGSTISGHDCIQAIYGVTVNDNIFNGVNGGGSQHPDMIQAQGGYWKIYNNIFTNIGDSAIDFDTFYTHYIRHVHIYNNVFHVGGQYSIYPQGIRMYDSMGSMTDVTDLVIANNNFIDVWLPLRTYSHSGATISGVYIQNNIFYNSGQSSDVVTIGSSPVSAADWHFDYNLVNRGISGSSSVEVDGSSYTQAHPRTSQPKFTRYAEYSDTNDYHLLSTDTAAKDQGTSVSSVFTVDKDGVIRPQGSTWDIGIYEYGSGGGATACSDGTAYNQCSTSKPLFCLNGDLISRCTTCGCPGTQNCESDGSCTVPGQTCGNNVREGTEVCDGTALAGQTCATQGFNGGTLRCMANCQNYDTSSCTGQSTEIIVDNTDSGFTSTGSWYTSGYAGPYGSNSKAADVNQGSTATWTLSIPDAGTYAVYAWWTEGEGRINDAKYQITHASGTSTVYVNQKVDGGQWNLLGTYTFNAGSSGYIKLTDSSSDPNFDAANWISDSVCADAIRLVPGGSACNPVHEADNDPCDGCVSQEELLHYVTRWKSGQATLANLMGAIASWKKGC
jgi:hypothetical protein